MRKIVCFHNPDESNGYLSNWYLSKFVLGEITFSSMEQYMMYEKAQTFGDQKIADQILMTDQVGKIKSLGRSVRHYQEVVWNGVRQIRIYEGLLAKFGQNQELLEKLLETGDAILAECAVQDRIWGIGLSMKDEKRFDMQAWKGQNLLGYALMEARSRLKRERNLC